MKKTGRFKSAFLFLTLSVICASALIVSSRRVSYADASVNSFNDLINAVVSAKDFDETVILIDDLVVPKNGPVAITAIDITNKNIIVRSSKESSTVSSDSPGCIMIKASKTDTRSRIRFENVNFKTQNAETPVDPNGNYSSTMQYAFGFSQGNIDASFDNCSFKGYQYGKGSGACINCIYTTDDTSNQQINLAFNGCSFQNNVSNSGAVYLCGKNNVTTKFFNCKFENNSGARGGAVFSYGATVDFYNSVFTGNKDYSFKTLSEDMKKEGGAICVKGGSDLTIDRCSFVSNEHVDGSAVAISASKATVSNSVFFENKATDGSVVHVTNSAYSLASFVNNTFSKNESFGNKFFNVDKNSETENSLPQEIKTKIVLNTFYNNSGKLQNVLNDERVSTFANLFVDDEYLETAYPSASANFNAFLSPETFKSLSFESVNPDSHLRLKNRDFKLDSKEVEDNVSFMFSSVYGNFYTGSNCYDKIILHVKNGKTVQDVEFDDVSSINIENQNKFGYNFNEFTNYTNLPQSLISFDTSNEIIEAKYSLNKTGVYIFIVLPIAVFLAVGCCTFTVFAVKRKRLNSCKTEDESVIRDTTEHAFDSSQSWIEITINKPAVKEKLSTRETDVLVKLLEGKSRKVCAKELFVTESTIKKHSANIYKKFNVKNRAELVNKLNNF